MEVDYEATIGAFEIGVIIAMFLFGITSVQTFSYFKKFPQDTLAMKSFVGSIWLLECVQSALICASLYQLTVKMYGQPDALNHPLRFLCFATIIFAIITTSIQAFFAYRVRLLCDSWIIPCICWCLSFCQFVGHIAVAVLGILAPSFLEWRNRWRILISSLLVISTLVDILIAASLTYCMWTRRNAGLVRARGFRGRERERDGERDGECGGPGEGGSEEGRGYRGPHLYVTDTNSKMEALAEDICQTGAAVTGKPVDKLISWSLQTCLATSTLMLLMLILFLTMTNFAWITVFFTVSRLFSNTFLASLNGREILRKDAEALPFINYDLSVPYDASSANRRPTSLISHLSGSTPDGHAHDSTSTSTNTDVGVDVTASPELHQDPTPAVHGQSLEQKRISWTKDMETVPAFGFGRIRVNNDGADPGVRIQYYQQQRQQDRRSRVGSSRFSKHCVASRRSMDV